METNLNIKRRIIYGFVVYVWSHCGSLWHNRHDYQT
nr:MAG TPA: hypothetical protein [Caudoviricetes sp.]